MRFVQCIALLLSVVTATAQDLLRPEIGKPCPDFVIRNVMDDPDSVVKLDDLKGRFVILDFWSKYCSACAGTFPHVEDMYRRYQEKVVFLLIGFEDKQERMRPMFFKMKDRLGMTVPFAFDSVLFNRFVPDVVPHLIWIDDQGNVQAVSASHDLTPENIESFLNKHPFDFQDWSFAAIERKSRKAFDYSLPFLLNGNGGVTGNFQTRSVLTSYDPGKMFMAGLPVSVDRILSHYPDPGLLQGCGTLEDLYKFAYLGCSNWYHDNPLYGKIFPKCKVEVKDTVVLTNKSPFSHTG